MDDFGKRISGDPDSWNEKYPAESAAQTPFLRYMIYRTKKNSLSDTYKMVMLGIESEDVSKDSEMTLVINVRPLDGDFSISRLYGFLEKNVVRQIQELSFMYKDMIKDVNICISDAEGYSKQIKDNPDDVWTVPNKAKPLNEIHIHVYFLNYFGQIYPTGRKKKFHMMPRYQYALNRFSAI